MARRFRCTLTLLIHFFIALSLLPAQGGAKILQASPPATATDHGWQNSAAPQVTPSAAREYYGAKGQLVDHRDSGGVSTLSYVSPQSTSASTIPAEIGMLARNLDHDPVLIFEHVYNNIKYVPYFGARKGSLLTHLDGSGNDFDQANLLVDLLRASGYAASYVYGQMTVPGDDLANWLGVAKDASGASPEALLGVLKNGAIPVEGTVLSDGTATISRVVVRTTISGSDHYLDPALKRHTYFDSVDLEAAMGYDRSQFRMLTGGVNTVALHNLQPEVKRMATELTEFIESQQHDKYLHEIIGGKQIETRYLDHLPATAYPISAPLLWNEIPANFTGTLRIQYPGIDHSIPATKLEGRRLTLSFSNGSPQLRLGGEILATGTSGTEGSVRNLTISFDQPYAPANGTYTDSVATYPVKNGATYAIVYSFGGDANALTNRRQKELRKRILAGAANDSEPVLGETLNLFGMAFFKQTMMVENILSQLTGTIYIPHHAIGVAAQEEGFYIDVKTRQGSYTPVHQDPDDMRHYKAASLVISAFEHGAIEQLTEADAVSTARLFRQNAYGGFYHADSSNWVDVRGDLEALTATFNGQDSTYTTQELNDFEALINAGYSLVLPPSKVHSGSWLGKAYIAKKFTSSNSNMQMVIGGGYFGGYTTTTSQMQGEPVSDAVMQNTTASNNSQIQGTPTPETIEPIDLASGAYFYDHVDLALGGGEPHGLTFARAYDSRLDLEDRGMGHGWTHGYDIYLKQGSQSDPVLGARLPREAATTVAALYAIQDILGSEDSTYSWVAGTCLGDWLVSKTIDNSYTLHRGKQMKQFIRLVDGTYSSPPGDTGRLISTSNGVEYVQRNGSKIEFVDNRAKYISDVYDETVTITYSGDKVATVKDAFGRTMTFNYTGDNLRSVTDSSDRTIYFTIDSNGNLTHYTDAEGNVWQYRYDDPAHPHAITEVIDAKNVTLAKNVYDALERTIEQTVPRVNESGGIYEVTYKQMFAGYRSVEEDPYGHQRIFYFDGSGRTVVKEDALGRKTLSAYNAHNQTTRLTDHLGNVTRMVYDENLNLAVVTNALGETERYFYESTYPFLPDYKIDGNGIKTDFAFNANRQLKKVEDELGNFAEAVYDPVTGLLENFIDGRGITTHIKRDAHGNPDEAWTEARPPVDYAYSAIGNLEGLIDQVGAATAFTYTDLGDVATKTDPLLKQSVFRYDEKGKLADVTDRNGDRTLFARTPTNKLRRITYADNRAVTYHYDDHDQLLHIDDALGRTSYTYDAIGRIETLRNPFGMTIAYDYLDAQNKFTVTYPGNKTLTYTRDALGRIAHIDNWKGQRASYDYNGAGQVAGFTNFNGVHTSYEYDDAGRLADIVSPVHAYHVITHDGNGNPVDVIKSLAQPLELQMSASAIDYTFNPKKNRLQTAGGASFTYDAEGQLATGYGMSFDFDYEHRLKRVTSGELVFMEYSYDAGGNRLQTIRDGLHVTRYVYDASGNLIAETDGNNNVLRYYIYGAGLVAMATADGEFHSYHYDYTGNTMALADEGGNIVNRYAYDPFGFNTTSVEAIAQPFTYVGRYGVMKDPTGFYYMRARFYDPQVGRFISEDPLNFYGGDVNLFAYAKNNPITAIDPDGLAVYEVYRPLAGGLWGVGWHKAYLVDTGSSTRIFGYSKGGGVMEESPSDYTGWGSHRNLIHPGDQYDQDFIEYGENAVAGNDSRFSPDKYDPVGNNCIHFVEAAKNEAPGSSSRNGTSNSDAGGAKPNTGCSI